MNEHLSGTARCNGNRGWLSQGWDVAGMSAKAERCAMTGCCSVSRNGTLCACESE